MDTSPLDGSDPNVRPVPTNIVLTGFMGTGKSTVGRLLATMLTMAFVDTDQVIEERHGPIAEIFAKQGEDSFRSMEHAVAVDLGQVHNQVIATGGRFMLDPANASELTPSSRVFCLHAEIDEILERVLRDAHDRPLLAGPDPAKVIEELMAERATGYAQFEQVDTNGRSAEAVAGDIASRWRAGSD